MPRTFEEYLEYIEKNGDDFPKLKSEIPNVTFKLTGTNGLYINYKKSIYLNYGNSDSLEMILIEDISKNKQFTNDFMGKNFKLYLSDSVLYIDFNEDYYYALIEFDNFEQFEYCQKNKKLTIALLNDEKKDIVREITSSVNLL